VRKESLNHEQRPQNRIHAEVTIQVQNSNKKAVGFQNGNKREASALSNDQLVPKFRFGLRDNDANAQRLKQIQAVRSKTRQQVMRNSFDVSAIMNTTMQKEPNAKPFQRPQVPSFLTSQQMNAQLKSRKQSSF